MIKAAQFMNICNNKFQVGVHITSKPIIINGEEVSDSRES